MDQAVTRWLNALAGNNLVLDALIISVTQFGIPVLVLLVILQWWSRAERTHVRHACVAAGLARALYWEGTGADRFITRLL